MNKMQKRTHIKQITLRCYDEQQLENVEQAKKKFNPQKQKSGGVNRLFFFLIRKYLNE